MLYTFKPYAPKPVLRNHLNLGGSNPRGTEIQVTSSYLERDGRPWIPVMGEFHYCRYDHRKWEVELQKMKAGGITVLSTYLLWIYHEEEENIFDFSGNKDLRQFVLLAQKMGLEVVLRIGGWSHGECRNGGFPDWLIKKGIPLRQNDPAYLEIIRRWYTKVYEQVQGLMFSQGGPVIGVQLDNELTDQPEHLAMLKEIAREIGFRVPLYTVTGWGPATGARIPVKEVLPVFGGYCEGPWVQNLDPLPPNKNYYFMSERNDCAIGEDLLPIPKTGGYEMPYDWYPFATCELGGGVQVTWHRRPEISAMDIYALSLVKLGCGNNLPGYYMFHGGTNGLGRFSSLQESKASGYLNDCPIRSYDFQAPIGEDGVIHEQYRLLRLLHLFVQDYGEVLAPMQMVPASCFVPSGNTDLLRYCMRTDGMGGFVFVNHYERLAELRDQEQVAFETPAGVLPEISVTGKQAFFLPFGLELQGHSLRYALAQPVCIEENTHFFVEIPGIRPEYEVDGSVYTEWDFTVGGLRIVTLSLDEARFLCRCNGRLCKGRNCDLYEWYGEIRLSTPGEGYEIWEDGNFRFVSQPMKEKTASVTLQEVEDPGFVSEYMEQLHMGGCRKVRWYRMQVQGEGLVRIDIPGDVLQIYADGVLAADWYYYGTPWYVDTDRLGGELLLGVSEWKQDHYYEHPPVTASGC